jgi:RiboL-PSP-HEPN
MMKVRIKRTTLRNIQDRYNFNIRRVNRLIDIFDELGDRIAGSYGVDLLRAAVVLLHAALEDVLRNMIEWKLPLDKKAMLARLRFPTTERKEKCSLLELVELYPDKTVQEIQTLAFEHYLNHLNWNSRKDIEETLKMLKLGSPKDKQTLLTVDDLIQRRHLIVHQGDRDHFDNTSHGKIRDLDAYEVREWIDAVEKFILPLLLQEHPIVKRAAARNATKITK